MSSTTTNSGTKDTAHDLEHDSDHPHQARSNTFFRLLSYIVKHRGTMGLGMLVIVLGTASTLLEPRLFGFAIDEAILPKRLDRLTWMTFLFVGLTSVRVLSVIQQAYLFELLGQKVTQDLRVSIFSHLQRMPVSSFDRHPSGRFLTRVTNDIGSLGEMFSAGFVSMLCNILLVTGILIWLLVLDLRLGLIAGSVFPFLVVISAYFSKRLSVSYREARSKLSIVNTFLAENLSGMKTVHLFNRQKLHLEKFDKFNNDYANAQIGTVRIFALFQPTITVAAGISIGLIIWFGGKETLDNHIKLGVLVAYFSYVLSLFQPVREIADKWNIFLSGLASAERIFAILDWSTEHCSESVLTEARPIEGLQGRIEFQNVWFAYQGENWILKDFSLEILPGQKVGVVGHTGAGKTTLISLLLRFYEPQRGRILIDGREITQYDKRSLRASIGIIQQDVFLFSGTFEENITFWRETQKEKMDYVLSALDIAEFANESDFQERGSNFSMGERQMMAFARAFVAGPQIWILDEATSNMDSDSESKIQKALKTVSAQKTCIFIAHRLATVRDADLIVVLHKGTLVEKGNHASLVGQDGLYSRLYRYQYSLDDSAL